MLQPVAMKRAGISTEEAVPSPLGITGKPFWQEESYDRYARNALERDRTIRYIEENPVSAGLVTLADLWRWSSRRLAIGGRTALASGLAICAGQASDGRHGYD